MAGPFCIYSGAPLVKDRIQLAFLLLVLSQTAHSIEEYFTRLYQVFGPARFVSSLVSSDLAFGFVVVNCAIVGLGLACWAYIRSHSASPRALIWCWAVLEFCNGVGHLVLATSRSA